ncbi:hypothetical protein EIP86_002582 [Pleurotus ostreatoroseus]|nr:hypothetical protein EIP86_002582 [Pleurotus ostreatoroseus]
MKAALSLTLVSLALPGALGASYNLAVDYSGANWFDKWDFYGDTGEWNGTTPWDNTTVGDVFYMGRANGSSLAYVDSTTGHAIVKVDNTSFVPYNEKRNSIRITTKDWFNLGTIWVFDVYHLPWGCSVWPGIWTKGVNWPDDGEIDIVEGVNRMTYNQMALHTLPGCFAANGTDQTGKAGAADCSPKAGCTVIENTPNSYGQAFADNNGGVWATMFDTTGVFIWFWERANVPAGLTTETTSVDPTTWGAPSAAYPSSSCDMGTYFGPQQVVIDVTLCGQWGGLPNIYSATCGDTPTQSDPATRCYLDNVINNGSADLAYGYFEFGAVRAFSNNFTSSIASSSSSSSAAPTSSASASGADSGSTSGALTTTSSGSSPTISNTSNTGSSGAAALATPTLFSGLAVVLALLSCML